MGVNHKTLKGKCPFHSPCKKCGLMPCFSIKPWGRGVHMDPWACLEGTDGGGVSVVWAQNKTLRSQELSLRINGLLSSSLFK